MAVRSRVRFVTEFLASFLHQLYVHQELTPRQFFMLKRTALGDRNLMLHVSHQLFSHPGEDIELGDIGPLRLVHLHELRGKDFPFILVTTRGPRPKPLTCFVGCRFTANIEKILEFNLRTILDPWNVEVRIEGSDLDSGDLLSKIIAQIRAADFAVFDNRGTFDKPNVYIEAGICFALRKPMILCEYVGRSIAGVQTIPVTGKPPTDFGGLNRVHYKSYEHLCREIYLRFPKFLKRNRLVGRRRPARDRP
jgi:hypothetical protein